MSIYDFDRYKPIEVTSATDTPTISRALCFKITSGDDSITGTGEVVLDWTNISSQADIAVYDENNNLFDYYFESFDATNETAVIWVYRDWVRDGSTQAKIAYGSGPSDQSVSASTVFDKEANLQAGFLVNETSGDALDVTSNNNDGTVNGATQGESGIVGGAYSLDGQDDNIDISGVENISFSDKATLLAWVKLDVATPSNAGQTGIHCLQGSGADNTHYPYTDGNAYFSTFRSSRVGGFPLSNNVNRTNWHLVAIVTENATDGWKFYQNTELVKTADGESSVSIDATPYLGFSGNSQYFDGLMDVTLLFNEAFSETDIIAFYDSIKSTPDFFSQQAVVVVVTTDSATNVTGSSATLNGTLESLEGNSSLDVYFEWGTSTSYGNTTASQTISSVPTSFDADISGLTTFETYHYRAVATDGSTTWTGGDVSFYAADLRDVDETQSEFQDGTLTDVEADTGDYLRLAKTSEGFEDGSFSTEWNINNSAFEIKTDRVYNGSYSAGITSDSPGSNLLATFTPDSLSGGKQLNYFEFYWQEDANSTGAALRILNSSGNHEISFCTDNPEWVFYDGSGNSDQIYSGDGYDRWIYVKLTFDWSNGVYDYYIEDLSSGHTETGTRNLDAGIDIESFEVRNWSSQGEWGTDTAECYFWLDNLILDSATTGNRLSPQLDLSSLGTVDDTLIEWAETLNNQTITIETRVSLDGGSTWTAWATATNGGTIPDLSSGTDVNNGLLECRQNLSTSDSTVTPELHSLNVVLIEGAVGLTFDSISQNQGIDELSLSQLSTLTLNNVSQSQSIDAVSLSQLQQLTVNAIAQGQSLDSLSLDQLITLSINAVDQGQTLDDLAISLINSLTIHAINQPQVIDSVSLNQLISLSIEAVNQAQSVDVVSVSHLQQLAINAINQGQTLSEPTVDQLIQITIEAVNQGQTLSEPALSLIDKLTIHSINQGHTLSKPTLAQLQQVVIDSINQTQSVDSLTADQIIALTTNNINQSQSIDGLQLSVHSQLVISSIIQDQNLIGPTLEQFQGLLDIASVSQGQAITAHSLEQISSLITDSINQGQSIDTAGLDQLISLSIDAISQGQILTSPVYAQLHQLDINNIQQGQNVGEVNVSQISQLIIDSISQGQIINSISFSISEGIIQVKITTKQPYTLIDTKQPGVDIYER